MLILGLLLIVLAAVAAAGAVFVLDGDASYFGIDIDAFTVFIIGAVAMAFLLTGLKVAGFGAKREMRARREHKQLSKLSEKLDRVERENGDDEA